MIVEGYMHQWPEEFGRGFIPYANSWELGMDWRAKEEEYPITLPVSTYCARCECDHGSPLLIVMP